MIRSIFTYLFTLVISSAMGQVMNLKFDHIDREMGLSQSNVICILQDHHGFMWFGTRSGLNKFDGYKFTVYKSEVSDKSTLSSDFVSDLVEDKKGNIWVATLGGGLNKYIPREEKFVRFSHKENDPTSLVNDNINSLCLDHDGNLWVGTEKGLDRLELKSEKITHFAYSFSSAESLSDNHIKDIFEDHSHNLWIGTLNGGVDLLIKERMTFKHFKNSSSDSSSLSSNSVTTFFEDDQKHLWVGTRGGGLNLFLPGSQTFERFGYNSLRLNGLCHNVVLSIAQDSQNNIWIGTENGGLSVLDYRAKRFRTFVHDDVDQASLSSNSIWSLYKDINGDMWVGTFNGGINFLNANARRFAHFRHSSLSTSLSHNSVLSIYEDRNQELWIGTDGGGLNHFNREKESFDHLNKESDPSNVSGNYVLSITEDFNRNLWIGTWGDGISVLDPKRHVLKYFKNVPEDPSSLSSNNVWTIFEDSKKNIWIGTYSGGVDLYHTELNKFVHFHYEENNPNSISGNYINVIQEDSHGNLWFGTAGDGLTRLSGNLKRFTRFEHHESENSISNNTVNCVYAGIPDQLWIGTNYGLNLFDQENNRFSQYHVSNGLPDEGILGILPDDAGNLWLSTNGGLSRFNPSTGEFKNFTPSDGLQSMEFKSVCYKSRDGRLYFGGINGYNEFYPDSIEDTNYEPPLVLLDFQIFNKSYPLDQYDADLDSGSVILKYDQSVISFEFASLNYRADKKLYSYFLEGFDKDWNYVNERHLATYTNLDPGDYVFHVRGQNSQGGWSSDDLVISLNITPPFWHTWWFKSAVITSFGVFIIGLFGARERFNKQQEQQLTQQVEERTAQLRLANEQERRAGEESEIARQEAERADKAKSIFLATMSHELRTPMNGVIGMASLLSHTTLNTEQQEYTETILTCSDSLLGVINDILDYSKIESGKMNLELNDFNLRKSIEEVLDIFAGKVGTKGLDLIYQIDHNVPTQLIGDNLRLRQVLTNLVGNAIKFTQDGEVFVGVHLLSEENGFYTLGFEVRDTGIGIPADKIDSLFKAFSQVDSSTTRKFGGTGLGLVICKKLVELMGGEISVSSKVNDGTTFWFSISTQCSIKTVPTYVGCNMSGLGGKRVLVVDDNSTNRTILTSQLEMWKLIPVSACSGEEALEILLNTSDFDLVITDVQMPEMDGSQLAKIIRMRHPSLPIILLSSMGDERSNDYPKTFTSILTKPVKQNILCRHILDELGMQGVVPPPEHKLNGEFEDKKLAHKYPLQILLAEDNAVNQKLTERVLNKLGYSVNIVINGKQALDIQTENNYDLILMDVQMPEMDGLEATREIRSTSNTNPIIIAMTANAMQSDRDECIQAGMNDYISKPIKLGELVKLVEKWGRKIHTGRASLTKF